MGVVGKLRVWCAISGHGFGHLAQSAPVLNGLADRVPGLHAHLVVDLPEALVHEKMHFAFGFESRGLDVGLVQTDPFQPDLVATVQALEGLHARWDETVEREARRIQAFRPDLVFADVPYLTLAAAHRAGVPSVALASLTWDAVLEAYYPVDQQPYSLWLRQMQQAYGCASHALLPAPAIPTRVFSRWTPIGAVHGPLHNRREELRDLLGIDANDRRPLVLVSSGGISAKWPIKKLREMEEYLWLIARAAPMGEGNLFTTRQLGDMAFADISASVDLIVTKPGYNTIVEAVAAGVPVVYVARGRFPDENVILEWLDSKGVGRAMSLEDFDACRWTDAVSSVLGKRFGASQFSGAEQAVDMMLELVAEGR